MQSITPPEKCPGCQADRYGIQERRFFFKCGTWRDGTTKGPPRWHRSAKCFREGRGSEQKIQAGQGDSDAVR